MIDELILYVDRGSRLHIVEPSSLENFDDYHPVLQIAVNLMNAGFEGLEIDEKLMSNGKYFQALNTDLSTREGKLLYDISQKYSRGEPLPSLTEVIAQIRG